MPGFARRNDGFELAVLRARRGDDTWTDDNDQVWAWDGSAWRLIQPSGSPGAGLLPVEDLVVVDVDHFSVTVEWTNPTQVVEPTEIEVQIPEITSVWTTITYPATTFSHQALDDQTSYQLNVRLAQRVDGVIAQRSAIASVFFVTSTAPVGTPTPTPGGGPGDTDVPIDIPIPGGGDPVDTVDGCWYEWELQVLSQNALEWISTLFRGTQDGGLSTFTFDATVLNPSRIYRGCVRTACDTDSDGIADEFGEWQCGAGFPGLDDWTAQCAGIVDSPFGGIALTSDAVFRFPRFCKDGLGEELVLTEAVTGIEVPRGPGFGSFFTAAGGEQGVLPIADIGATVFPPTMVAPVLALAELLTEGQDATLMTRFRALEEFSLVEGRAITIASYGGRLTIRLTETTTGWVPSVVAVLASGLVTLEGPEIPRSSTTHTIAVRWDADGTKDLWVDGTVVDADASPGDWEATEAGIGITTSAAPRFANLQQTGWDRVLTLEELDALENYDTTISAMGLLLYANGDVLSADGGSGGEVMFDYDRPSRTCSVTHDFVTDGTFTPETSVDVDALVVAAGGSGGPTGAPSGGGGGGQVIIVSTPLSSPAAVTIGQGAAGLSGEDTQLGAILALGGGRGGSNGEDGVAGGCGGGAGGGAAPGIGAQGDGGASGGGGGAGEDGTLVGGDGLEWEHDGTFYGGGGGGGKATNGTTAGGAGGGGDGGDGGFGSVAGENGVDGLGGGGGGGGDGAGRGGHGRAKVHYMVGGS